MMCRLIFLSALMALLGVASAPQIQTIGVSHRVPLPKESIVERVVYDVTGERFEPPIRVRVGGEAPDVGTPERAAFDVLAAKQALDWDAWLRTLDSAGREYYSAIERGPIGGLRQLPRHEVAAAWKEQMRDAEVLLIGRFVTEVFAVVTYEIRKPGAKSRPGEPGMSSTFDDDGVLRGRVVLGKESNSSWLQAGRFASHPVVLGWRSGREERQLPRPASMAEWSAESTWPPQVGSSGK